MLTLLLLLILLHQIWALRRIERAALARTPAEFAELVRLVRRGVK